MKIAILGAGISGLVTAHHLHSEHDITVFEAGPKPGGHTNTIRVELDDEIHSIDTGFIVFNEGTYPRFTELLKEIGISSRPTEMGFSVRDDSTGLEYGGQNLNGLFAQRRNAFSPRFLRMLLDILKFNRRALNLADPTHPSMTVAEYLESGGYSRAFAHQYLLPMGAAIWSCPVGTFSKFPIRFILDFFRNHGLLNVVERPVWRVIAGGSQAYVTALTAPFRNRIRLHSPVVSVRRLSNEVHVTVAGRSTESFDHVVFACHSDQALRILGQDATVLEREVLRKIPYCPNLAVLHTDTSVLPRSRRAWTSWNYRLTGNEQAPATVTYNMNILQGLKPRRTFCVTLNDESQIDPARIIDRFVYHHPVFTTEASAAHSRHGELLNQNRTSFCGAYWGNGFHEDGVVSALRVVDALKSYSAAGRWHLHHAHGLAGTGQ